MCVAVLYCAVPSCVVLCCGVVCCAVQDTLACLEMGAVETLIVWEALDYDRWERCYTVILIQQSY